uniref:Putative secreted protein n=1 Tax=Anopheles darlingi TaxID=43151 RepID=A0A2M4DR77_ANODA
MFFNFDFKAMRVPVVAVPLRLCCHQSRNFRNPESIDISSDVSPGCSGVGGNDANISRAVTAPIPWIPVV